MITTLGFKLLVKNESQLLSRSFSFSAKRENFSKIGAKTFLFSLNHQKNWSWYWNRMNGLLWNLYLFREQDIRLNSSFNSQIKQKESADWKCKQSENRKFSKMTDLAENLTECSWQISKTFGAEIFEIGHHTGEILMFEGWKKFQIDENIVKNLLWCPKLQK